MNVEKVAICELTDLNAGSAISREIAVGERTVALIIYAHDSGPKVFLNSCPHTGVRLEWRADDFMDLSGKYFQCAMHGALFTIDDGRCVAGPCKGQALVPIESEICGYQVMLRLAENLPSSAKKP